MTVEDRGQATAGQISVGVCYVLEDKREGPVLWPGGIISSPCSHESYLLVILMTNAITYVQLGALIFF